MEHIVVLAAARGLLDGCLGEPILAEVARLDLDQLQGDARLQAIPASDAWAAAHQVATVAAFPAQQDAVCAGKLAGRERAYPEPPGEALQEPERVPCKPASGPSAA